MKDRAILLACLGIFVAAFIVAMGARPLDRQPWHCVPREGTTYRCGVNP